MPAYDLSTSAPGRLEPAPPLCPFGPSPTGFGWLAMTAIACLHWRCPFAAVLGGVPVRFRVTAFCPMHRPEPGSRAGQSGTCYHRFTSWAGISPARLSSCQGPKSLRLIPAPLRAAVVSQRIAPSRAPAPAHVRPARSKMVHQVVGRTAQGLEPVREVRKLLEAPLVVNDLGPRLDLRRPPAAVERAASADRRRPPPGCPARRGPRGEGPPARPSPARPFSGFTAPLSAPS